MRSAREYRRRDQIGLMARTVRIAPRVVTKMIEVGYLSFESRGDAKARGIAIEAYLAKALLPAPSATAFGWEGLPNH
jgi:hypothetical protein